MEFVQLSEKTSPRFCALSRLDPAQSFSNLHDGLRCHAYISHFRSPLCVDSPSLTVELLELADQYMLDHLKEMCEARLQVRSCFLLSMPIDPNICSPPLE